jgi:hypothetical protein
VASLRTVRARLNVVDLQDLVAVVVLADLREELRVYCRSSPFSVYGIVKLRPWLRNVRGGYFADEPPASASAARPAVSSFGIDRFPS